MSIQMTWRLEREELQRANVSGELSFQANTCDLQCSNDDLPGSFTI